MLLHFLIFSGKGLTQSMAHAILHFHPHFAAQHSLSPDMVLYHIFPVNRFKEMIENQSLYFRRVVKWPDTYEYPVRLMNEDRREVIEHSLFGFCLAQKYDKEAMWKLYSGCSPYGVCIQTTVDAFCKSIYSVLSNKLNNFPNNAFIGKVQYVSYLDSRPSQMFEEDFRFEYPDYMYPAYLKRDAFSYEEEVRLLVHDMDSTTCTPKDGISKPLSTLGFIHKVIVSPYASLEQVEEVESLCKKYAITAPVCQSPFLKELDEGSSVLPDESLVYWGSPQNHYDILQ